MPVNVHLSIGYGPAYCQLVYWARQRAVFGGVGGEFMNYKGNSHR